MRSARALWRIMLRGDHGLADGYVEGYWTTPDLTSLIEFGIANETALAAQMRGSMMGRAIAALRFRLQNNSRQGARRNIARHYDLGNEFFAAWLDETMTYSSAIFPEADASLEAAQREKYRQTIAAVDAKRGDRIFEIGSGWGAFAIFAAQEAAATVTALTISQEQADFARKRVAANRLQGQVDIRLQDYRDAEGVFDSIVSIEMFEAIGEKNWPVFFGVVRDRLKRGGRALLQVITVPDARFLAYRNSVDFIQAYIFPGGMLPSAGRLKAEASAAGLTCAELGYFGHDYAVTLVQWNRRFQDQWPVIRDLGFDERFRRTWTYYLNSCEACFRQGVINVGHFLVGKP
jgi:cyclopropane-fatty-acyl-phospholipid synthase